MHARLPAPKAGRVRAGDIASIEQLERAASECRLCRLCHDRSVVVTGDGPIDADVLVVAEAPGYHEDREARLLAGRPGELFDSVLEEAGLERVDVFLTSVVKCRPPTGRTPFPDEVEACEGWLFREIELVQPQIVVTLGALALRLVTGRQEHLADVHGMLLHAQVQGRDLIVWPLYHPAAALHVPSLVEELRTDARGLGGLLRGAYAASTCPTPAPAPALDEAGGSGFDELAAPQPAAPDEAVVAADDSGEQQLSLEM